MERRESDHKMLEKGVILAYGEVDKEMYHTIHKGLMICEAQSLDEVTIRIRSQGGRIHAGFDICDLIRQYPGEVIGKVVTNAYSMGTVILQACAKRIMTPNSHLLIHDARTQVGLFSLTDEKKLKKIIKTLQEDQEKIQSFLSARTGVSAKKMMPHMKKDKPIDAQTAKKLCLVDEISE